MASKWSPEAAALCACSAVLAKNPDLHEIMLASTRDGIRNALTSFVRHQQDRDTTKKWVKKTRKSLAEPILKCCEALRAFDLAGDCEAVFGMPQRDLIERLQDLHNNIEHGIYFAELEYASPRHRPKFLWADRLIMQLAAAFTNGTNLDLEVKLTNGSVGLNPAFIDLLNACFDELPPRTAQGLTRVNFIRRAKRRRSKIVKREPLNLPFLF